MERVADLHRRYDDGQMDLDTFDEEKAALMAQMVIDDHRRALSRPPGSDPFQEVPVEERGDPVFVAVVFEFGWLGGGAVVPLSGRDGCLEESSVARRIEEQSRVREHKLDRSTERVPGWEWLVPAEPGPVMVRAPSSTAD